MNPGMLISWILIVLVVIFGALLFYELAPSNRA
jgi:hypothetical protein